MKIERFKIHCKTSLKELSELLTEAENFLNIPGTTFLGFRDFLLRYRKNGEIEIFKKIGEIKFMEVNDETK